MLNAQTGGLLYVHDLRKEKEEPYMVSDLRWLSLCINHEWTSRAVSLIHAASCARSALHWLSLKLAVRMRTPHIVLVVIVS